MAARPTVNVQSITDGAVAGQVPLPAVFSTAVRRDLVKFAVAQISKNSRQPYAVSRRTGHKHSAESWGTGRAVSRIPRVSGGGTHASGAAAFGNMCRGGHMFANTKTFRRWHVAVPRKLRRAAVCSAIAASACTPLVQARGHKVQGIKELPLVAGDAIESITKTKAAMAALKQLGVMEDVKKAKDSVHMRAGKGKWRNRRYITRKGPLIVFKQKAGAHRAFRNIPGVEAVSVNSLSVLKLAPGGHVGRLVIWSESALKELDAIYGTDSNSACPKKAKFRLPRPIMKNADVTSLLNRSEIQQALRPKRVQYTRACSQYNPLNSRAAMKRISPMALVWAKQAAAASKTKTKGGRRARRTALKRKLIAYKKASTTAPAAKTTAAKSSK